MCPARFSASALPRFPFPSPRTPDNKLNYCTLKAIEQLNDLRTGDNDTGNHKKITRDYQQRLSSKFIILKATSSNWFGVKYLKKQYKKRGDIIILDALDIIKYN